MLIKATFSARVKGRCKMVTYTVSKKHVNQVLAWLLNHPQAYSIFTLVPVVNNTNFIRTYHNYPNGGWASNGWLQHEN